MNFWNKTLLLVAITATCIGCDRVTKDYAKQNLVVPQPRSYFHGTVQLQYEENPGGMMSIGAHLSESVRFLLLTVFVGVCLLMFLLFALANQRLRQAQIIGISMILGGGCGNLFDRLANDGMVIDFIILRAGQLHTGVFNVADVSILSGVVVLLFLRSHRAPTARPAEKLPAE